MSAMLVIYSKPLLTFFLTLSRASIVLFIVVVATWLSWLIHKIAEICHWKRLSSTKRAAIRLTLSLGIFLALDMVKFENSQSPDFDLLHTYFVYYSIALLLPYALIDR